MANIDEDEGPEDRGPGDYDPREDLACVECDMYGDYQCSRHGGAVIAAQAAEREDYDWEEWTQRVREMPLDGARRRVADLVRRALRDHRHARSPDTIACLDLAADTIDPDAVTEE